MKVTTQKKYNPVTIVLETENEFKHLRDMVGQIKHSYAKEEISNWSEVINGELFRRLNNLW
jgi:desulfoferrodoxin (superoxide reductase-like protein)